MKILFTLDNGPARLYKILLANTLTQMGLVARVIPNNQKVLDEFLTYRPDVFFGSYQELDRASCKALVKYSPKVILTNDTDGMKTELFNEFENYFNSTKPISCGFIGNQLNRLRFGHTVPDGYVSPREKQLKSDVLYVGQNKPEKTALFQQFLFPLLYPNTKKLNVKVVGGGFDGLPNAVGVVMDDANLLALQANTKFTLNLSNSPYVNFRVYQSLALSVPVISNRNPILEQELSEDITFVDNAQEIVDVYKNGIKIDWVRPPSMFARAHEFMKWIKE
jgi:hypothetical protein